MKEFKIALISDIHEDINSLKKYLKYVDENDVDIGICLGDSVSTNCDDDTNYFWTNALQISKPIYYTIGNHDVGIDNYKSLDNNELYNLYIKQLLENNYLEEKNLNNKGCYYYRDFEDQKIRIISIFEYEGTKSRDLTIGFEHRRYISSTQLNCLPKHYMIPQLIIQ